MDALRKPPFSFDVVLTQKDLFPRDPNLVYYPLIYIHGRARSRSPRRTSRPCAGTSSPAAARSSPTPPAAAPPSTPPSAGSSPSCCPTTRSCRSRTTTSSTPTRSASTCATASTPRRPAAAADFPQLEGVKINGHWVDHLLQVRHRLRTRAPHGHRMQGLHLRERRQDRRQHRDLLHVARDRPEPCPSGSRSLGLLIRPCRSFHPGDVRGWHRTSCACPRSS